MSQQDEKNNLPTENEPGLGAMVANVIFWPVFLAGFVLDLWSKAAIFEWLGSKYPPVKIIIDDFFRLIVVQNPGAAWGMAAGQRTFLIVISIIAIFAVFGVFLFWRPPGKLVIVSLAFFAAGICGNLHDRIFNDGKVRDFLDFYWREHHWPAFNVADSLLTIAVGILIVITILNPSPKSEDKKN
ncbi:MAG: signal peptidase II [Anaerohalosphaeraceae bacterium]|nr:signal peptidase II [Anaerohalosphaeraceae bacterium]